jgi:hypothetical protein
MAIVLLEGFDKYGGVNTNSTNVGTLLNTEWTSVTLTTSQIVTPLSVTGQALFLGSANSVTKTLPANFARLIGGVRITSTLAAAAGVQFNDTATAQCGFVINTTGTITIRTGNAFSGTIIATSTASVTANSIHYVEWDLTFSATGAYQIWLDGVSVLSGTGNLRTTANNYANAFVLGTTTSGNATVDDCYLFDNTGTTSNAALLTSPRIETTFPSTDASVQFAVGASVLGTTVLRSTGVLSPVANTFWVRPFTPTRACTLNSISVFPQATSGTINLRPIVYADSAGVPGTLMSGGSTVTGVTSGTVLTMPLTTPQSLTAGTQYWLGFMNDIQVASIFTTTDTLAQGRSATATFASGAPGTAPATTAGQATILVWGNITLSTPANFYETSLQPPLLPTTNWSYVNDSTVGHEDLYNMAALTTNPVNLYAVAHKVYWEKSDTGARTMSVRTRSGGTEVATTAIAPGTSYTWAAIYHDTDPATSLAWTLTGVNAAQAGYRIES